jgi:DNA-binding response OmpR family regulator
VYFLVIEDNLDLLANLYDFLETKGHTIDSAADGHQGLALGMRNDYDAIVLDLMLPGLDGLEVARRLRASCQGTPILMLTARDTLEDKLEGFASGADDYLVKPFALRELEARLAALVRRRRGEHVDRPLHVGELTYDPATRRVRRAGHTITLPPIPLKLLVLLMRESPKVVSRQAMERELWGDSPPDSDALRAHIHILRNAIDKPFAYPLLTTVHGVGYRLAAPDALSP